MIWHYFPIGMRFPVRDFSDETRRACWRIALSAAYASDPCGTGLYEACEAYDPIAQSPVYTCIVCYVGIKQSRAAGKTMHALDGLMTRLCLVDPLVQANYLESFGPYPILAEIDTAGKIVPNEQGAAFLPTEQIEPMQPTSGWTLLLAPDSMRGVCNAETLTRILGTEAAAHGLRVRRMPVADGGEGTVRALIAGIGGRHESVVCEDLNGERVNMTVGVIPGPIAVIEAAEAAGAARIGEQTPPIEKRSSFAVGMLIRKMLDLGYRRIWIGLGDTVTADLGLGALSALGVRFFDRDGAPVAPCPENLAAIERIERSELDPRIALTELTVLCDVNAPLLGTDGALMTFGPQSGASQEQIAAWETEFQRLVPLLGGNPSAQGSGAAGGLGFALASIGGKLVSGADRILERIGFGFAMRDADFVVTGEGCFDAQSIRFRKASVAVLERLCEGERPGCLFIGKTDLDTDALLREHAALRGIVICPCTDEPYADSVTRAFVRTLLPMIGKDVAKGQTI